MLPLAHRVAATLVDVCTYCRTPRTTKDISVLGIPRPNFHWHFPLPLSKIVAASLLVYDVEVQGSN